MSQKGEEAIKRANENSSFQRGTQEREKTDIPQKKKGKIEPNNATES